RLSTEKAICRAARHGILWRMANTTPTLRQWTVSERRRLEEEAGVEWLNGALYERLRADAVAHVISNIAEALLGRRARWHVYGGKLGYRVSTDEPHRVRKPRLTVSRQIPTA